MFASTHCVRTAISFSTFACHSNFLTRFLSAALVANIKENHPLQTASICSTLMNSIVNRAIAAAVDRDSSLVAVDLVQSLLDAVHLQAEKRMFAENVILREKARIANSSTKVPPLPLLTYRTSPPLPSHFSGLARRDSLAAKRSEPQSIPRASALVGQSQGGGSSQHDDRRNESKLRPGRARI
jgi:hypothetical protein